MTETSNYRRIGRNGSTLFQRARSLSTFVLLVVVVVCVLFAYQYMSTNAELSTFRTEFEQSNALNAKLKNELLEMNVKFEKEKLTGQKCRERGEKADKELQACKVQNDIDKKLASSHLHSDKIQCERNISRLRTQLDSTKDEMEMQKRLYEDQVTNLTRTVEQLRSELALLQHPNSTAMNSTDTATAMNGTETHTDEIQSQAKRTQQNVQNDARERLDESEVAQQEKRQQDESNNDKANENEQQEQQPQRRLMGAGGRVRLDEMAAKSAENAGGANGGNGRELLQAAAKAQQKEEEDKAQQNEEKEEEEDGE